MLHHRGRVRQGRARLIVHEHDLDPHPISGGFPPLAGAPHAEVNENLARDNAKCMFVTLFIGVLDLDTGELLYANGGHNPPLRLGDDGVAWLKGISGPVVGAMEGMNYTLLRTVVRPGETLFLYTDGVNEAMNAEGDVYSNEAMFRALASSPSREPASVLRHMLDDVSVHVNGNTASDDMTILCVRYFGGKR